MTLSRRLVRALLAGLSSLPCSWAFGAEAPAALTATSPFHVDAFGTFGLSTANLDHPRYRTDFVYLDGIGTSPTAKIDTRAGLQLGWTPSDTIELNVQGLLANNLNDETRVQVSWAYLRAQLDPRWSVKVGRFRTPGYLYADTLDVGYAYPWVRPPVDLYTTAATFHSNDGVLLQYRVPLSNGRLQIEPYIGRTTGDVRWGGSTPARLQLRQVGVATSLTQGATEFFGVLSRNRESVSRDSYDQLLAQCRAMGVAPCDDYDYGKPTNAQYDLGVRHDDQRWMIAAELAYNAPGNRALSRQLAAYVSVGHYFGDLLPYITWSRLRALGPRSETRFGPLNPIFSARLANQPQQHSWSVGVRWDFTPGLALKAQLDRVRPDGGSPGTFSAPLPPDVHAVRVATVTLDWTY